MIKLREPVSGRQVPVLVAAIIVSVGGLTAIWALVLSGLAG